MPDRLIRASGRNSHTLDALSDGAERMFWRLTVVADDYGCFDADARVLLANCFPLKVDRLKPKKINRWLQEMVTVGLVRLYGVEGRIYGCFPTWLKHQRPRNSKPKFPLPPPTEASPQFAADRGDSPQTAAVSVSESGSECVSEGREAGGDAVSPSSCQASSPEDLMKSWNTHASRLLPCQELTQNRRLLCMERLRTHPLPYWDELFTAMNKLPFLRGENDRGWKATFDWIIENDDNAVCVREGKYGTFARERSSPTPAPPGNTKDCVPMPSELRPLFSKFTKGGSNTHLNEPP